jgi:cytochrome c-type biogenesis protein CcmH/NrfF
MALLRSLLAIAAAALYLLAAGPEERAKALEAEFMAPCCWGEGLPRHNSEAAAAMKAEIAKMVAAGKSDREIKDAFIARYGKRILRVPEGNQGTLLTVVPFVMLAFGVAVVAFVLRAWLRRGTARTRTA